MSTTTEDKILLDELDAFLTSDQITRPVEHAKAIQNVAAIRKALAAANEEMDEVYEALNDACTTVQEVLLRLRVSAARPSVREALRDLIKKGAFDGIED